jgi:prepilin-type N-terminal cleavage/methylation domain-containing protein
MMILKPKKIDGFTLIELLMVICIILILASIGMPLYLDHRDRAFNMSALTDLKNLKTGLEAYYADNQEYPNF